MPQKLNSQLFSRKEIETLHLRLAWPMTWPRSLKSLLLFKIPSRNSSDTTQLSKMFCDYAPLTVQQFRHNFVSPKFPAALFFLNLLETPSLFGEYLIFFLMILKTQRAFDYFSQFKCCVKRASNYFIFLMVSPSAN